MLSAEKPPKGPTTENPPSGVLNSELELEEEKPKEFYVKKKGFFLTYSQCPITREEMLTHLKTFGPKVVVICQEHHQDGNLHLHCWVEFEKDRTIRDPRYFDYKGHHCSIGSTKYKKCNTRKNALNYMLKEDKEPACFGLDLEAWKNAGKKHRSLVGELLVTGKKTVREIVQEYPQEIYNMDKLLKNVNLYKVLGREIPTFIERRNFWIVGRPGVGKSYMCRMLYEKNLFMKSINKWWDGYAGEEIVLLDDFGKEHKVLSYYMKIWGDNYAFNGEIKGGMIVPAYKQLLVTSNYFPEDIWSEKEDPELLGAINRRFQVLTLYNRDEQDDMMAKIGNYELLKTFKDLKIYNY